MDRQQQKALDEMRTAMLSLGETLEPIFEQANGIRQRLERDGWSPTAAEAAALEVLTGMLHTTLRGPIT